MQIWCFCHNFGPNYIAQLKSRWTTEGLAMLVSLKTLGNNPTGKPITLCAWYLTQGQIYPTPNELILNVVRDSQIPNNIWLVDLPQAYVCIFSKCRKGPCATAFNFMSRRAFRRCDWSRVSIVAECVHDH